MIRGGARDTPRTPRPEPPARALRLQPCDPLSAQLNRAYGTTHGLLMPFDQLKQQPASLTRIRGVPTAAALASLRAADLHVAVNLNGHHWNAASESVLS